MRPLAVAVKYRVSIYRIYIYRNNGPHRLRKRIAATGVSVHAMSRAHDPATVSAPPTLSRRGWLVVLGFWTFMGLLESSKAYVSMEFRGIPMGFRAALVGNMPWWYLWALLTPVVFTLGRRARIVPPRWGSVITHVAAAVTLSALHLSAAGVLYYYTTTRGTSFGVSASNQAARFLQGYLATDVVTYFAVLTAFEAFESYRRLREREIQSARLEARNAQLESRLSEIRLSALRAELQPHFLFNTLNTATGLVRAGERDTAVNVLARLGDLLRSSLAEEERHEVPLAEEIAFLRRFLEIEEVRFRDRLSVQVEVPEELGDALVPTRIIQPLVENALRHGIAPIPGSQHMRVRAWSEDDLLAVEVSDSGAGFTPPAVEGIGLGNTRARLDHLYGGQGRLVIAAAPGRGTRATLLIPLHRTATVPRGKEAVRV